MEQIGRILIGSGLLLLLAGLWVLFGPRLPWVGRLPGDVLVRRPGFTLYAPLATSLLLSILLSLIIGWLRK